MNPGKIYRYFFGTLRGRLILGVAAIHALMMTLFIADVTMRQHALLLGHQLEDAAGLSRTLAVSAADWIAARDISGLQELVNLQLQYPELIFAIIADEDGQIFAHTDSSRAGQYLTDLPAERRLTIINKTPALVDVAVPAFLGGRFVGWARVGVGQKTSSKKLAEITRDGVIYAIGAILIGSLIAWFMGIQITRRLYSVENTIGEIKAGNHSARCALSGTDEAAVLASEFNVMLDSLAKREAALGTSERNLREAQRLARIGSWEWDAQTDAITWSEEYYRIYGFDVTQKPPGYVEHLKAYTPESAARLDAAVQKNMRTGEPYEIDLELAGPEPRRWITARSETIRDRSGKITGLRGTAQDITERKRSEQTVAFLSFALNSVCEAAFLVDENARFHFVNEEACRVLGYTRAELLGMGVPAIDPDFPLERWRDHWLELKAERSLLFEGRHRRKNGDIFPVEINANYIEYEGRSFNLSLVRDITERKRAEHERQAHLFFLDCMDKINQAMQGTNDLEQMMCDVLDAVLAIFDCDRAFLLYPCDPEAALWSVPMERNKPEYPGVLELKLEMKMSPNVAETLRILLESNGPVKFGPDTPHPLPEDAAERFGFKSLMSMALRPKSGKPWQFGMHQCSRARIWTQEEEKLFNEIGRRLEDALSTLITYNELKDSRIKLEEAQRLARVGYLERDMAAGRVTLSDETCRIFGISTAEKTFTAELWLERWLTLVHPRDRQKAEETLEKALKGSSGYDLEYRILRHGDELRHIHCEANIERDGSGRPIRMLVMIQDITERKTAEEQILKLNRIYAVLSNTNQAIVRIREKEALLNEACRIAIEYGGFQMAWVGMADFQSGGVHIAASHGVIGDYLKNVNINLNDEARGAGPAGFAIKTGTHRISNDIRNDEIMTPWRDNALKHGYRSVAAFPLTVFGKTIGTFIFYSQETGFFETEDIALLDEMAKDISFALEYIENEKDRRRNFAINASRLHLMQFAASHSIDELLEETLNEVEKLTGSLIGFYHFIDDDQNNLVLMNWSTRTKKDFCRAAGKGSHYPISEAGVWVDCVHQRKPVIHNDYASLPNRRGMPAGHAVVARELIVPVIRGEKIRAILGVGNSPVAYSDKDVEAVSLLADLSWEIAERKMSEETISKQYSTLRGIIDNTDALIFSVDRRYRYTSFNLSHAGVMKSIYGAEIAIGRSLLDYMTVAEDREKAKINLDRALSGESLVEEAYSGEDSRNRLYFQISHNPIKAPNGEIIGVAVFAHDITGRRKAEEQLKTSLKEKDVLLRELYHRTKNNMQVICSMLEVYHMDSSDENTKTIFSELNNKIRAMALVHQKLYKSQNLSSIDMNDYIRELVGLLMKSHKISPERISSEFDLDEVCCAIDVAIPCGLLVNELVSNALKHAFAGDRRGRFMVSLKKIDAEYLELTVSDDGTGTTAGFDFETEGKMGLQTVSAIGKHQLQGKIKFESLKGVTCAVTFKNKPPLSRTQI